MRAIGRGAKLNGVSCQLTIIIKHLPDDCPSCIVCLVRVGRLLFGFSLGASDDGGILDPGDDGPYLVTLCRLRILESLGGDRFDQLDGVGKGLLLAV
jgi:hypothetical protein